VYLWEPSDSDYNWATEESVPKFVIYFNKGRNTAGGCGGKRNDCLYDALLELVGKDNLPWVCPGELKKFLGIGRTDLVDIAMMPMIDKRLNRKARVKINIMGDHTYTSTANCVKEANITLSNAHYKRVKSGKKVRGVKKYEKRPLLYHWNDNRSATVVFNGEKKWEMTEAEFRTERKNTKSEYIMIPASKKVKVDKKWVRMGLKKQYGQFIREADELKKYTHGELNMYKTGTDTTTISEYIQRTTKTLIPDPIYQMRWNG
jgi:hypothetical protein